MDSIKLPDNQLIWRLFLKYSPEHSKIGSYKEIYKRRSARAKTDRGLYAKAYITALYKGEEGLKLLARRFGVSYTNMRSIFKLYDIKMRKGRSVVTDKLREFRKDKALNERKNHTGFANPEAVSKCKSYISRGVQNYYYNKHFNKNVWLRSTYEFIFAKWLDKTKHRWDIEVTHYKMNDGRIYRPDFFLYDETDNLIKIVEIKGYWDNNSDKAEILNEVLDIEVVVITDINQFIESDSNYHQELTIWKKLKLEEKIYGKD